MNAMVLCAGFGTGLLPLTEELPKPLVPVGDRPALLHIARELVRFGATEVALNTHHRSEKFSSIIQYLPFKAKVSYEPRILGTAGGIARAARTLKRGPLLVWNGDVLTQAPPRELVRLAQDAEICLGFSHRPKGKGTLGLDRQQQVVRLRGEVFGVEESGADYVGLLALAPDVVDRLPARGCVIGDVVLPRLRRGLPVRALEVTNSWTDLGSLPAYLRANINFAEAASNREIQSFVAPGARVERSVTLNRCVVGAGAVVSGAGMLKHCVIWPGAQAEAPLSSSIVTTGGMVVRVANGPPGTDEEPGS